MANKDFIQTLIESAVDSTIAPVKTAPSGKEHKMSIKTLVTAALFSAVFSTSAYANIAMNPGSSVPQAHVYHAIAGPAASEKLTKGTRLARRVRRNRYRRMPRRANRYRSTPRRINRYRSAPRRTNRSFNRPHASNRNRFRGGFRNAWDEFKFIMPDKPSFRWGDIRNGRVIPRLPSVPGMLFKPRCVGEFC